MKRCTDHGARSYGKTKGGGLHVSCTVKGNRGIEN